VVRAVIPQLIERLKKRELSAEDLVRSCLRRIDEREPVVHAWEHLDPELALREARRIDAQRDPPWLRGIPVGIKDLIDTADFPTEYGTEVRRGHRPGRDAACVSSLRKSGAIVLGKTVTTELASYTPGKTRNPRDPSRTPGGSSSGSAAAVADGMVPAAVGSQTAGSVVRPASYCGVVGFKPTFGALDLEGVHPLAPSLDTLGFFVEAVEDAPVVFAALRGLPQPPPLAASRPRVALCRTEQWNLADAPTRAAIEGAAEKLGASRDVDLPRGLAAAQETIMAVEAARALAGERTAGEARLSPKLRDMLQRGDRCPRERYDDALAQLRRARAAIPDAFRDADVLLTPAATGEAPAPETTGDPAFSRIWTLLGVPCLSLPVLRGPAGLPLGLQLIGAPGRDDDLLAFGAWIASRFA
jgi:Asp-tRNA(Asn)/Glu-tRNA(Gln) amidotransferase A subunit family amidase